MTAKKKLLAAHILLSVGSVGSKFLLLLCLTGPLMPVFAQSDPDPGEALRRAYEKGNLLSAISIVGWKDGLTLAGAILPTGQEISLSIPLQSGRAYSFIGTSETRRSVIDLSLFDESGTLVAADEADDSTPIIEYIPDKSGNYRLKLYLRAADEPELGVAIALLNESGNSLAGNIYRSVSRRFLYSAENFTRVVGKLNWSVGPGNWCVYGMMAVPDQLHHLAGVRSDNRETYFAVTGPEKSLHLSLYLANASGKIFATTSDLTANPIIRHRGKSGEEFMVSIKDGSKEETNFLLLGVFN